MLAEPAWPLPFELNLNTGPGDLRVDLAPQPGEEHWFAIDRSLLAGHGVALLGPPAAEVFASPPKEALLPVLAQGLRWYAENGYMDRQIEVGALVDHSHVDYALGVLGRYQ